MVRRALVNGALVGLLLAAPLAALLYLFNRLAGLPFPPFELFDWVTRVLPGPVVTFGIDAMIDLLTRLNVSVADTAKAAEQTMAILQFIGGGVLAGALFFGALSARRSRPDAFSGLVMGALFGLPLIAISLAIGTSSVAVWLRIAWLLAVFLGWGLILAWSYRRLYPGVTVIEGAPEAGVEALQAERPQRPQEARQQEHGTVERLNRRQFLILLGAGAATVTVIGAGLGAVLASNERRRLAETLASSGAHQTDAGEGPPFPNADDPVSPAPGTRPEYTPIKDHYKVFIRTEPTVIDGATWTLPVTGLVDNPLMLTLEELRARFSRRDQYVTISCISGKVGTRLISTTQWSGAPLKEVLAAAGLQPQARYLHIMSGDGFYETIDLELVEQDERIMLCYAWDGNTLPVEHGFPLRVWIPDRYGMKQPKWITSMEISDQYTPGYWVERGWDEVAQVKATSVIDMVAVEAVTESNGQQLVPVGGIAFAGARGISKVEVRVDGGAAGGGDWQEARLRSPLSETTWVIWRYEWPFSPGEHTFEVRCAEGDGAPQIETPSEPHPSGSSGIHRVDL
jgi:DMSO/TMAO reductase YedYZ molybdopterin-dependent catalytic subunit